MSSRATGDAADATIQASALPSEHARWLQALARLPRVPVALAVAVPLLGGALLLVQAWLLARVLDLAIVRHVPRQALLFDIGLIAALVVARATLAWVSERAGARAAEDIKQRIRLALFDRLVARGPMWSRTQASGELASAMVDQVEGLEGFFSRYLPAAVSAAILPVAFAAMVLPVDWIAGLLLLVTAPLIPLFMALVGWGAEAASRRHVQAFSRLSGFFADRVRGVSTLKLYGRAQAEVASVAHASEVLRQRTMSVLRIAFLSSAVLEFFAALGVAGMAVYFGLTYLGFLDVRGAPLTLQTGFFCLLMAPEVYAPLRQFAAHYHDRAAARAAAAQMAAAFDGLPVMSEPSGEDTATVFTGHATRKKSGLEATGMAVAVRALTLTTPGRIAPVIDAVSFTIAAGEHVALMGPSGCGKTTLLETLGRLRPGGDGVMLDGCPLASWDEAVLRRQVAVIGQKPFLFADSVAANIRLGCPHATAQQIHDAARRAGVLAFTQSLPDGLETRLGPRGRGLSGGQAQRVALARLFLRDPALILLDEPTAHLDSEMQKHIMDEILAFAQGRTLLVATHASSVAQQFSRTMTIARGRLVSV